MSSSILSLPIFKRLIARNAIVSEPIVPAPAANAPKATAAMANGPTAPLSYLRQRGWSAGRSGSCGMILRAGSRLATLT